MGKGTKNPETKMIADTGYGRVFFENAGTTFSKTANQYDAIWILLY